MNYQITIDGDICRWGYSKQYLREQLAQYKGKHVDMRISSLGGDLDHGLDMRQQLIEHGDVTVYLTGFVASSATVIAMGAKRLCMSRYAMFLVHKCSNFVDAWGRYNADELEQLIATLEANKQENDKIDVVLARMYAEKCNKPIDSILDVLKKGAWLTADEALEYGFIDEITEDEGDAKANLTAEMRNKFNAYNLPIDGLSLQRDASSGSILRQILDTIKEVFSPNPMSAEKTETVKIENVMVDNTTYTAVMAALAVESLSASEDGAVTLSAEQMQSINDRLNQLTEDVASRDNTLSERDATISSLNAQVEDLKKLPGDTTTEVKDDCDGYMTSEEVYNLIKNI